MTSTSSFRSAGMASACKEDVAEFIAAITAEAECGTGSSVKIVKYSIGRLEVAFAYEDDQDITANLSQISAATGLQLPES